MSARNSIKWDIMDIIIAVDLWITTTFPPANRIFFCIKTLATRIRTFSTNVEDSQILKGSKRLKN